MEPFFGNPSRNRRGAMGPATMALGHLAAGMTSIRSLSSIEHSDTSGGAILQPVRIGVMGFGGEYRINLYRNDERLSLVMVFHARADADARDEAERLLVNGLVRAEIWRDDVRIGTIDSRTGQPRVAPDQRIPQLWRIDF